MPIPSRTIKGLQDIRSHSGRAKEGAIPHKAYMRLSCLEMEKFRRARERESAMVRVRNIDARFLEIDAEKTAILALMDQKQGTGTAAGSRGNGGPDPLRIKTAGGFRLKY